MHKFLHLDYSTATLTFFSSHCSGSQASFQCPPRLIAAQTASDDHYHTGENHLIAMYHDNVEKYTHTMSNHKQKTSRIHSNGLFNGQIVYLMQEREREREREALTRSLTPFIPLLTK